MRTINLEENPVDLSDGKIPFRYAYFIYRAETKLDSGYVRLISVKRSKLGWKTPYDLHDLSAVLGI